MENIKHNDHIVLMEDFQSNHKSTFRTQIEARDEFGDILFTREENLVVLGGALAVLEKLWNIRASFVVDTINNIMTIGDTDHDSDAKLTQNNFVCLWGVGTSGATDTFGNVHEVNFKEREIASNGNGRTEMIPFRTVPTSEVSAIDDATARLYYLKKDLGNGYFAYYGKKFESTPEIYVYHRNGADGEDGTDDVPADVYQEENVYPLDVFVEMKLELAKTDVREWFESQGNVSKARINTVGLFIGEYDATTKEYKDVKLFSKFNFDNESLANKKEIHFTYRVYAS